MIARLPRVGPVLGAAMILALGLTGTPALAAPIDPADAISSGNGLANAFHVAAARYDVPRDLIVARTV